MRTSVARRFRVAMQPLGGLLPFFVLTRFRCQAFSNLTIWMHFSFWRARSDRRNARGARTGASDRPMREAVCAQSRTNGARATFSHRLSAMLSVNTPFVNYLQACQCSRNRATLHPTKPLTAAGNAKWGSLCLNGVGSVFVSAFCVLRFIARCWTRSVLVSAQRRANRRAMAERTAGVGLHPDSKSIFGSDAKIRCCRWSLPCQL